MKNYLSIGLVMSLSLVSLGIAKDNVKRPKANQAKRIQEGRQTGKLTAQESKDLRQEGQDIKKQREAFIENDGKLDENEKKQLQEMRKKRSNSIHEKKHNDKRSRWKTRNMRIEKAKKDGRLSEQDAKSIEHDQAELKALRQKFMQDGALQDSEKETLKQKREALKAKIHAAIKPLEKNSDGVNNKQ